MTEPEEDLLTVDDRLDPAVRDLEAPTADAVEQATPADPAQAPEQPRVPFDADEADALDQAAIVAHEEDDYR